MRWSSERHRERDPRRIGRLLARHLGSPRAARILDAPCGTGRLRFVLEPLAAGVLGLDVSPAMLETAGAGGLRPLVRADVERLPFREGSFDAVVCCRLLHHLADDQTFLASVRELVRVSADLVVATFWDAACLPELGLRRHGQRPSQGRVARERGFVLAAFREAGAEVLEIRHSMRWLSRQAYLVARKRAAGEPA